jgi:ATP synthase subunit 6
MLKSPIEQFNIILIGDICIGISNLAFFFLLIIILIYFFSKLNKLIHKNNLILINNILAYIYHSKFNQDEIIKSYSQLLSFIPNYFQFMFESFIFEFVNAFKNLINHSNLFIYFYSLLTSIFFILLANLIGLIPYSFTITAQIFITFNLSVLIFFAFNIIGYYLHNINIIELVIPNGIHISLNFLLIPIEIISYSFRPISLSIRLFANIMAGHTLLKVICGFIYKFFELYLIILLTVIPFAIITILFGLECFVALIQSYVFFILVCLFLKDILHLSH